MSNLRKWDPFAELTNLQRQFFGDDQFTPTRSVGIPTTDVYTTDDDEFVVEAHLPNFGEDDIDIEIQDNNLIIQAERHERSEDDKKYVVRESSSSFHRQIQLPQQIDESNISADVDDGVLRVVVPFERQSSTKKIPIGKRKK